MHKTILRMVIVCSALSMHTVCAAYDCNEAESYRNGKKDLQITQQVITAQLAQAVNFLQKQNGVDFDVALRQVMQIGTSEQIQSYDDQLDKIGTQIKTANRDSPEACAALLVLQQQYVAVGQQKMTFIVKFITGANSAPR